MAIAAVLVGALGLLLPRLLPGVPQAVTAVLLLAALLLLILALAWWGRGGDACGRGRGPVGQPAPVRAGRGHEPRRTFRYGAAAFGKSPLGGLKRPETDHRPQPGR